MTLWYLARATGLVALIAFSAATAFGALATRSPSRSTPASLDRRFLIQMAHRSTAVLGLLLLGAHAALIVADSYVDVSIPATVLPFTSGYDPLAVGIGTLALYAFVITAVSGAMRGRLATSATGARRWRFVHLSAYVGWASSMGHGVLAGSDTGTLWSTAIYAGCGLAVFIAVAVRLRSRASTPHSLATARTLVRSTS